MSDIFMCFFEKSTPMAFFHALLKMSLDSSCSEISPNSMSREVLHLFAAFQDHNSEMNLKGKGKKIRHLLSKMMEKSCKGFGLYWYKEKEIL